MKVKPFPGRSLVPAAFISILVPAVADTHDEIRPDAARNELTIPTFQYDVRAEGWLKQAGGFDMPAALRRFSTDSMTLARYYSNRLSRERARAFEDFDQSWQNVLNAVPFDSLDVDGRVDWLLLAARLRRDEQQRQIEKAKQDEMAPLIPFAESILILDDDLRHMVFINGASAAAHISHIADQITQLTADINAGRLKASPAAGRRAAHATGELKRILKEWHDFYNGYDPGFTWWIAEPWKRVDSALTAYSNLLGEKIAAVKASAKDTIIGDPVGREALERALRDEFIPYTPDELIARARAELAWCQGEMVRNSRAMGYGEDWHKALEKVKNDYVSPGEQPAAVRNLEYEALAFIRQHDLITIPEPALNLWRMEMMSPERQRINPFFTGGELLSVSYPTDTMTEEQKLMSMRGNNVHYARATVFHEMIPGHFLQEFMSRRYRPWRQAFMTAFWEEGWAFYWETLLWDKGFARSPEDRIGMLFWRMHRAARVIFSLSFHLRRMTAPEAVDFLVKDVGHERENAAAEVRRSFETDEYGPLYQCAYELGAMQFRALHTEIVDSGKMTDRQFHDAVMKLGPMPVEMVRASFMGVRLPKNYTSEWRFFGDAQTAAAFR